MVLELFSTVVIDGAGAKAKKNSDKKKLKEAEGDPEKYNQIVEKIEQRKKKNILCSMDMMEKQIKRIFSNWQTKDTSILITMWILIIIIILVIPVVVVVLVAATTITVLAGALIC